MSPVRNAPTVRFDADWTCDAYEMALVFTAHVGRRDVTCLVSVDALADCFGCAWEDAGACFVANRSHIEDVVSGMIARGGVDGDCELRVRGPDLPPLPRPVVG